MRFFNRIKKYFTGKRDSGVAVQSENPLHSKSAFVRYILGNEARAGLQEKSRRVVGQDIILTRLHYSLNHIKPGGTLNESYFDELEKSFKENVKELITRNSAYLDDAVLSRYAEWISNYYQKLNNRRYNVEISKERLSRIKKKLITLESIVKLRQKKKDSSIGNIIKKAYGENIDLGFYREHPELRNRAVVTEDGIFHLDSLEEFGIIKIRHKTIQ
ncbi:hypothetical protein COV16_00670 [Candidatus Woesearchaeota archaeon CG10_big_fil_rev_8_21_14_0_10_34_8]|nr:MAG: hypothetical protein COV16_00670 [Candidatus Woesearchaeota archaeon CG10_big_fil_rev_8_21_14_0_10_34_8]